MNYPLRCNQHKFPDQFNIYSYCESKLENIYVEKEAHNKISEKNRILKNKRVNKKETDMSLL
jgi:hypothetical protein